MTIAFFVPGKPQGKGRPRIGRVGRHARMFTPEKTVAYEGLVALAAHEAMQGRPPLDGPLAMNVAIFVEVPASWSKRRRADALAGRIMPTTKPDADNTIKALSDAMNGVVWRDDVQAVAGSWVKVYAETPGVRVVVGPAPVLAVGAPLPNRAEESQTPLQFGVLA